MLDSDLSCLLLVDSWMVSVTGKIVIILLTIILLLLFRKIAFPLIVRKKIPAHNLSVDELSKALELTSEEIRDDKDILEGIVQFHDKTVAQIMTSRLDLFALEVQSGFKEAIENVVRAGYSRIPVYAETYDTIKGILYIKDLLPYIGRADHFRWQNLIRTAFFVPETKKIDDLLEEFRTNKIHLAIVVDEFGGTSGIVTMEDILEEIVGDINDEYDDEEDSRFVKLPDGSYIFEAKTLLTDFFKITGIDSKIFDKLTEDVETLAGLVLEIKGNFPEKQETVEFDKYAFQVLEINQRRILKVKFSVK
jgi:gliding motility-associated protein GldE